MKKTILPLFILAFYIIVSGCSNNELKEGKITISLSLPDTSAQAKQMKNMLPTLVMYIKNGNTRTEIKGGMGNGGTIMINNSQKGEAYRLVSMMGTKYAMKFTHQQLEEEKKKEESHKPGIQITSDTKELFGYHCKKALVTYTEDATKHPYECWYTNEIKVDNSLAGVGSVPGIDGFPLQVTMLERGMPITMTVKSVEKLAVADSMFVVPADYPVKTMQQLMQEMQMRRMQQQQDTSNGTASDTAAPIRKH